MKKNILFNKNPREFSFLLWILLSLMLEGCNTIEGLGTDIKRGGETLEHAAEDSKGRLCPYCGRYH